ASASVEIEHRFSVTNPLEPDLAPVGIDAPRTKQSTLAIACPADHILEDDTGVLERFHPTGHLIDDSRDSLQDLIGTAAIRDHFGVEPQTTVLIRSIARRENLFVTPDPDHFARLKIESRGRRRLPDRNAATAVWIRRTSSK